MNILNVFRKKKIQDCLNTHCKHYSFQAKEHNCKLGLKKCKNKLVFAGR